MELDIPSLSLIFASLFFLLVAIRFKNRSSNLKLPPGPSPLPLIGNIHQLASSPLIHRVLKDLALKYGPLMYLKLGQLHTIVVSSPEIAKQVMKTHDLIFAQRPSILASKILGYDATGVAFAPYGEYWRQVRKICTIELLSHKRVESFRPIREEEVENLIKEISTHVGETINLSRTIFKLTFGITGRAAFGKKTKEQEAFISLTTQAVPLLTGFSFADMYASSRLIQKLTQAEAKLEKIHEKQNEILQNILNGHRDKKTETRSTEEAANEDLVDVLLRVQQRNDFEFPLTDDNIKAVLSDIFSAGSETSSTTVEWAMSELLKNPKLMKRAQSEVREVFHETGKVEEIHLHKLTYLQAIIKETLRLHAPVPLLIPRESREQCEINGYMIPEKSRVIVNAYAIARTYWPEAERFNPDRFLESSIDYKGTDFEYIPFGAGRRVCPAMTYAHANIQLPLAKLLYHFDWKFPDGKKPEQLDMDEAFGLAVRRKNDLHLIPISYNPSPDILRVTEMVSKESKRIPGISLFKPNGST